MIQQTTTAPGWAPWPGLAPYARDLTVDGLRLFYYEAGNPQHPPLLLIHGLGDDADSWRHLLVPLAERHHVLALDLPGFGRSAKPARAYTLDWLVQTVERFLTAKGLSAATLAGSSLGAVIAQELALRAPGRVRSLLLLAGSLYLPQQAIRPAQLLMLLPGAGEWLYRRLAQDPAAAYASLRPYYAALHTLPPADRAFLQERVQARVADPAQRHAFLSTLRHTVLAGLRRQGQSKRQLARLHLPTLVIWGVADAILPVANAFALAETLPAATLLLVPAAGHLPHQEQPQLVLEGIRAHLAAVAGKRLESGE